MSLNKDFRRLTLMGGAAVLALAVAAPAFAQDANADAVAANEKAADANEQAAAVNEEIVVTGFRRSLENSIATKRDSDIIVEVVSADDIAGLPDVSIAEALARLPGVTSQRTGGQASAINVRGLSQDLVSATLNGREQVSTSGLRSIEFDQYPSELLTQAQVYKSPKASLIEGGVAGKIELKTARPLDNAKDLTVNVNLRGSYNDRADESTDAPDFGYRGSVSIQSKLSDTLGVALGYSRLVQPNVATRFVGFDYTRSNGQDSDGNGVVNSIGYGFEAIQFGGKETRDGALAVVQFEPVESTRFLLDGYYSRFKSDVFRRGVRAFGTQNATTQAGTLQNPIVANDAIVGGRFISGNGVDVELVNQDEGDRDRLYTVGLNFQQDFGANVTLNLDASYSKASSKFNNSGVNINSYVDNNGTFARANGVPGALVVDWKSDKLNIPEIGFNHDFTDPNLNRFQGFYIVPQNDDDELLAFAGDLNFRVNGSFIKSIEVGARYSTRNAERRVESYNGFGIANNVVIPTDLYKIGGFKGEFGRNGFPNFLVADIDGLLDKFVGEDRPTDQRFGWTRDQSFLIEEDVMAAYAQLNFDTVAGSLPFRGNIGVRVVHTDQSSTSSLSDPSTPAPDDRYFATVGTKYTEILPSANFILELSPHDRLRLSAGRQLSRARFFELRNAINFSLNNIGNNVFQPNGSGGNPTLRPYLAKQIDFGFEHYFGTRGILSAGVFYKDLESFVVGGTVDNFNYREAGLNFPQLPSNAPPGSTVLDTGPLAAPINGKGGYVYGFEAQFSRTFTELPAPFDGLGVAVNYAYSQSNLDFSNGLSGRSVKLPLPGLSKHVANPTIYYDKNGFSTRLGLRYRSSFVAPQFGLNEQVVTNAPELVADAQVSYAFQDDSRLHGLTVYLQANNLTDEPTRSYFGQEAQTGTLQYFGRQFYFGAGYKF